MTEREKKETISGWVIEYSDYLYSHALRRLPNMTVAEDIVQNTFLAAIKSVDGFKKQSSPKTWLLSILKNKVMDYYREVYKRKETPISDNEGMFKPDGSWKAEAMPVDWGDLQILDNLEFRKQFYSCIEKLPENWNTAVKIKYLEEKVTPEDVGISRANYWKMLERARKQLRTCLEGNWFNLNE